MALPTWLSHACSIRGSGRPCRGPDPCGAAGRFAISDAGNVAIVFALAAPVLAGLVGVAVDYSLWARQATLLQKAADAAALAATKELAISSASQIRVQAIAESVIDSQLDGTDDDDLSIEAQVLAGRNAVKVVIRQPRRAVLSRLVQATSGTAEVSATATMSGGMKVCVIALQPSSSGAISLDASARITAVDCLVHSNSRDSKGVSSKSASVLAAPQICSGGGYEGSSSNFSGTRTSDCPARADPLADRPPPAVGGCKSSTKLVIETQQTLYPGVYCEGIEIKAGARVTMMGGIYVIKNGQLKVDDNSVLFGRNVGIYFTGSNANFDFLSSSEVDLTAPKDGDLFGILFFGDRSAPDTREYKITSGNARMLVGTIYIPRGILTIDAKSIVADRSAYTAIIAHRIDLKQSPNLVLNTNYAGTDVPVPEGLGPKTGVYLVE